MVLRYFSWHYGYGLRSFLAAERNFLDFGWYFFSITELTRSMFAPWHQIVEKKSGGPLSGEFWYAWWGNFISRILGAMVRIITIFTGLIFEAFVLIAIAVLTFIWVTSPVLIPFLYLRGLLELI